MLASGRSLLTMATLARALVRAAHPQPVAARFASLTAAPVRAAAVQSFRPTTTIPAASIAARHSSGASYDKNAYANMPAEPQYSLPTDAPEDTFELFYFATRGRGEQIRMLLAESGLPYVDRLLSQWQLRKLKAAGSPISNQDFLSAQTNSPLPFGSLPMLRRRKDGLILGQTIAILQYIAEEGGLMPKTAKSKARAMMLIAGGDDLFQNYWPIQLDKNKVSVVDREPRIAAAQERAEHREQRPDACSQRRAKHRVSFLTFLFACQLIPKVPLSLRGLSSHPDEPPGLRESPLHAPEVPLRRLHRSKGISTRDPAEVADLF
jgi:hypothetical protein